MTRTGDRYWPHSEVMTLVNHTRPHPVYMYIKQISCFRSEVFSFASKCADSLITTDIKLVHSNLRVDKGTEHIQSLVVMLVLIVGLALPVQRQSLQLHGLRVFMTI